MADKLRHFMKNIHIFCVKLWYNNYIILFFFFFFFLGFSAICFSPTYLLIRDISGESE